MIVAKVNKNGKKFREGTAMRSTCNCGSCNCNCGAGCISTDLNKKIAELLK